MTKRDASHGASRAPGRTAPRLAGPPRRHPRHLLAVTLLRHYGRLEWPPSLRTPNLF